MAAKRRRLTENERQQVVAMYVELGNYSAVGRAFGVSEGAVRKIVRKNPDSTELFGRKKAERTADILVHMESRKELVCDILDTFLLRLTDPDKLERANVQQVATSMGILIDKFTMAKDHEDAKNSRQGHDQIMTAIRNLAGGDED